MLTRNAYALFLITMLCAPALAKPVVRIARLDAHIEDPVYARGKHGDQYRGHTVHFMVKLRGPAAGDVVAKLHADLNGDFKDVRATQGRFFTNTWKLEGTKKHATIGGGSDGPRALADTAAVAQRIRDAVAAKNLAATRSR